MGDTFIEGKIVRYEDGKKVKVKTRKKPGAKGHVQIQGRTRAIPKQKMPLHESGYFID